jgi:hypothetical protein
VKEEMGGKEKEKKVTMKNSRSTGGNEKKTGNVRMT